MGAYKRFALNRVVCPALALPEFFQLAHEVGVGGVELRNDLAGGSVIDSFKPFEVRVLADKLGITILSVNALQRFNVRSAQREVEQELGSLVELATGIGCKAIVLCPNNDVRDQRSKACMFEETVASLRLLRHYFEESDVTGLLEPLGFPESSLRSVIDAMRAITQSGGENYKIVHDTFHHVLGPDSREVLRNEYDIGYAGLVHVSGVESDIPVERLRDPQRVLVSAKDRLESRQQIEFLTAQGYNGPISFEPFAPEVQGLNYSELRRALGASLEYLTTR